MKKPCQNSSPHNALKLHRGRKGHSRGSLRWIAAALIAAVVLLASVPANANIGASLATSIADGTNTSSYNFPSATYSNNVLYIAFTSTACASGQDCGLGTDVVAAVESVSGAGLTFTEIGTPGGLVFSTDGRRIQAWRALATSGATTGTVTVTMQSGTISASMGAAMIEFTGTKTSGTNGADAVVQWPSVDGGSTSSLTVTMNAFANSNNRPVAFFSHRAQSGTEATTHDTAEGYTELSDQPHDSVMMADMAEWHATEANTTPSASWTSSGDTGGFALEIAAAPAQGGIFSNTSSITIPDSGQASLYPSQITVSGVTGTVTKVTVSVYDLNHTWADDIDMLLVGPGGQTVMLMSDQGYDDAVSLNLTFDDDAASELPDQTTATSGTYKPCVIAQSDLMDGPAPAGPYGTLLSSFNGVDPNGTWSLYIMDDATNDAGSLDGGWELNITTENICWSSELLTNQGFESGSTGWTSSGQTMSTGNQCENGCDATPHSGSNVAYWTDPSASTNYAYQTVDLSSYASDIDAGNALIDATGWFISDEYSSQDQFWMKVKFYDGSSSEIVSDTYDSGTQEVATWTQYGITSYTIPVGARSVEISFDTWENTWGAGSADDFSVKVGTPCTACSSISFDGASNSTGNGQANSISWSHTVTSGGSDGILVVGVSWRNSGNDTWTVSSVTYNSQPLTEIRKDEQFGDPPGSRSTALYYLTDPPSGTYTVQVNFSGIVYRSVGGAVSLTGVEQSNPVDAENGVAGATGTNPSVTVTTNTDGAWVVDALCARNTSGTTSVSGGQTERWNYRTGSENIDGAGSTLGPNSPAGDVTMSWTTGTNEGYSMSAVALKPACGSGGGGGVQMEFEDFETDQTDPFGNWDDIPTGANCDWIAWQDNTPSDTTGPGGSNSAGTGYDHTLGTPLGWYLYVETSSSACQGSEDARLEGPNLDGSVYSLSLSFWYHMWGSAMGDLHIDVSNNGGTDWTNDVLVLSGQQQTAGDDPYLQANVDLDAYTGTQVKVRFRYGGATGYQADVAIDDIEIVGTARGGAAYDQHSFQARNDNGDETTSTWTAAADTDWTQMVDKNFRVRFLVQETGGIADSGKTFQLQYNRNGAGWNDVTGSSSVVKAAATANVADATDTTQQLGSGTYVSTNAGFDEANGQVGSMDFAGSDEVEVEFSLQIVESDVANGDTIELRISGLDTYTVTPTITVTGAGTFSYKKQITLDQVTCGEDLSNFPVLIELTGTDFSEVADDVDVDGYDIIFMDSTETQVLDHEIEEYDETTNNRLVAWVRIPTLSSSGTTTIYMYYGNSAVNAATENPTGVWDSTYKGVWHLHDDFSDSTGNPNTGTNSGSEDIAGKIADADHFTQSESDYVNFGHDTSLDLTSTGTLSAWVNFDSNPNTYALIVGKANGGNEDTACYGISKDGGSGRFLLWLSDNVNMDLAYTSTSSWTPGNWYHFVGVWSGVGSNMQMYLNGQPDGSPVTQTHNVQIDSVQDVHIGCGFSSTCYAESSLNGIVDEVRISSVARDGCWIDTEHSSQVTPASFYIVGSQTSTTPAAAYDQDSFQARNDNGDETTSTWTAAADTDWTQMVDKNFRVRFLVQETGGIADSGKTFQLQYNRNGAGWNDVTGSSSVVKAAATANVADATDTTQQLGSGTYVSTNAGFDEANGQVGSMDFAGSDEVELEFSLQIVGSDVGNGDTIELRISGVDAYTSTPTVTVTGAGTFAYMKSLTIQSGQMGASCTSTTDTWQVSANDRDAWGDSANGDLDQAFFGDSDWSDAGGYQWAINIPQGATITSAKIRVYSTGHSGATGTYTARIRVEDVDNASAFTGAPNDIYTRTYWGTTVDWAIPAAGLPSNTWSESPDITSLIQHVVNRAGWSPGNYLNIAIWGQTGNGGSNEYTTDYYSNPSLAAQLEVTYQTGSGSIQDFPVMVQLTSTDFQEVADDVDADGYDIIFKSEDDATCGGAGLAPCILDHEIEEYDETTDNRLVAWVRIPTLSSSGTTTIYMYYGNSAVNAATENPTGVWDSSYKGVWHLKESAGGSGAIKNSTANTGLDGTDSGSPTFNATGQVDGAIGFDGNDRITINDPGTGSVLDFGTGASITLSAWIQPQSLSGYTSILMKGDTDNANLNYGLQTNGAELFFGYATNNASSAYNNYQTSSSGMTIGNWYHIAYTYTFGTASSANLYINGALKSGGWGGTTNPGNNAPYQSNNQLWFGDDIVGESFNGTIDEVRISKNLRSLCWIETEFSNQDTPASFYIVGSQTSTTPAAAYDQDSFRARNDNGDETTSTWTVAPDTNWTQMVDKNFRVRFLVQETGGIADSGKTFQLQYNRNGAGWNDVTGSSSVAKATATANVTDATDTTQQLGSGTYVSTNAGFDESDGQVGSMDFAGSDEVELEFSLQIVGSDVANGDTIEFRISGLDTYTVTPSITVTGAGTFAYKKQITLDQVTCGEDLTNFPVLIELTGTDFSEVADDVDADGYDIIFMDSTETQVLDHEIEEYDETTDNRLVAWVRIPTLSSSGTTTIYMYYGNSAVNAATENPTGVWDSNYVGVWHLNETPADGVAGHADSTGNGRTGTPRDFQDGDGGTTDAQGIAAGADKYETGSPADDRVEIPDDDSLTPTGDLTVEAWVKLDTISSSVVHIVYKRHSASPYFSYQMVVNALNQALFQWTNSGGTYFNATMSSGSLSAGTWYHLVGVKDGTTVRLYVNGSDSNTTTATTSGTYLNSDVELNIGAAYFGGTCPDGIIDETRISNVARDACWIETEHSNQGTPASFYIVGSQQSTTNSPPTLTVSQPDGTGDTVTVGDSYDINYDLADADDVVTVTFYYDDDNTGENGTAITGACATAAEGTGVTCTWDTTGMTPGAYYIYGTTNDGSNPAVTVYSSGQITIDAAPALAPLIAYSQYGSSVNNQVYYSEYVSADWSAGALVGTDPNGDWDQHQKVARVSPDSSKVAVVWKNYDQGFSIDDVMASIWDGSNWTDGEGGGPVRDFGRMTTQAPARRPLDAAFMQGSGRLLAAVGVGNVVDALNVFLWDGNSTWETGTSFVRASLGSYGTNELVRWLKLSARPGTNEIVLIASLANSGYTNASVRVAVWDGDEGTSEIYPFTGTYVQGSLSDIARVANSTSVRYQTEAIDVQHVLGGTYGGDAVAVWGEGQYIYSRTYRSDTSSWTSSTTTVWDSGSGNTIKWLRLKPQPEGDDLILAIGADVSSADRLYTIHYDGDTRTWGSISTSHTNIPYGNLEYNRPFDVIWDPGSGSDNILLVYSDSTGLRYKTSSNAGSSWNSQQTLSASHQAYWVQLERDPSDDTIHLAIQDGDDDLNTWTWASATWSFENEITTDLEQTSNHTTEIIALATYSQSGGSSNAPPTLNVDEPDGTGDTVTVGDNYSIQYDLADTDNVVTVAFYYDDDNSGENGTAITGECATAAEGTDVTCTWDTTGMTPGSYYVYGTTSDGSNPAVTVYSSGQITINAAGTATLNQAHVRWRNDDGGETTRGITVNSGHTVYNSGSSINDHVIDTPSYSAGDVIYIAFACDDVQTITWPSGFTPVYANDDIEGDATWGLAYKVAGASEPATYTVSIGIAERAVAIAWSVSNDGGIDDASPTNGGDGATATCNAATTSEANDLILRIVAADRLSLPHSTISGYTMLDQLEFDSGGSISVQYITQESIGSTGPADVTITTEQWGSGTVAIKPANAIPWWNRNYLYRKNITVTAGSAEVPSGYSVSATLDHADLYSAGKSLVGGDDVRVAYWDGATWTELDRALDPLSSWNDVSSEIWFKTQATINASSSDYSYYIYYGSPSASNPPDDWANVFMLGDDFNDGTLTSGMTPSISGTASITETGGEAFIDLGTNEATDAGILVSTNSLPSDKKFVIRHKMKLASGGGTSNPEAKAIGIYQLATRPTVKASPAENNDRRITVYQRFDQPSFIFYTPAADTGVSWDDSSSTWVAGWSEWGSLPSNTYYIYDFVSNGTNWYVRVSDASGSPITTTTPVAWSSVWDTSDPLWFYWGEVYTNFYYADVNSDWFYVRTYVDPEPTSALGGEGIVPAATFDIDEDTELTDLAKTTNARVRFLVSNSGGASASNTSYQLEFDETDTCGSGSYSPVPTSAGAGDKWEIVNSIYLTDGEATSDIDDGVDDALPNPGVMTFSTGELRDDNSNSTGGITLDPDEFTEIEFTIQATNDALDGTHYCFRLTNSGTDLNSYSYYAEVTLAGVPPNSAPTLSVSQPDGTGDTVTVGDSYNINYDLADSDDVVTVAFYYDDDSSGFDGTAITGECATAAEGTNVTCTWDTTGMTPGSYYVYGVTNDGTNPDVRVYSPGQISIHVATSPESFLYRKSIEIDRTKIANPAGTLPIAFDALSSDQTADTGASSLSWSHTVGSGSDRIIIVSVSTRTGQTISSVTFGGTDITSNLIGSVVNSGNSAVYMYYMKNPSVGPNTVEVTQSGTVRFIGAAISFFNVDQTTPFGPFASNTGSSNPWPSPSVTVTNASGQVVVAALAKTHSYAATKGVTNHQVERWNRATADATPANNIMGAGALATGSGNVTISWEMGDSTTQYWAIGGVAIMPTTVEPPQITTLTNYPLLYSVTDPDLQANVTSADGWDIIFRALDDTTCGGAGLAPCTLDHEIERYESGTGKLVAWVRIPSVNGAAAGSNTVIYIYYGNSDITSPTENKNGVWDSNFMEVWHLGEKSGAPLDSTLNNYTGTIETPGNVTQDASGNNTPAYHFAGDSGTPSYLTFGDGTITANGAYAIEGWVYIDTTVPTWWVGFVTKDRDTPDPEATANWAGLWTQSSELISFGAIYNKGNNLDGSTLSAGQWYYGVAVFDGGLRTLYLNGQRDPSALVSSPTVYLTDMTLPLRVNQDMDGGGSMTGVFDEVRVSTAARSPGWILTTYNNMDDPGDIGSPGFCIVGPQEGTNPGPFGFRKSITIDRTKISDGSCGTTLPDFPMLFSVTDGDLATTAYSGDVASYDAPSNDPRDIIFRALDDDTCGGPGTAPCTLDHEIEKYDETTGELVAWVRIPSVNTSAASSNTVIYVYYGNSDVPSSTQNVNGVWDDNYVGVWHLSENPNDGIAGHVDSTGNNTAATPQNFQDGGGGSTNATGKIGGADYFAGDDDYVNCGNNAILDVNYLTVELWINVNSWVTDGGILAKGDDAFRQYWMWTYGGAGSFEIDDGGNINNAWTPTAGQWQHLVLTYDGNNVTTYRNGGQENQYPQTSGTINATTQPLLFGNIPSYNYFDGSLDEVRITNGVRNLCWIQASFATQNDPGDIGSPGFYTMGGEEANPATAVDLVSFTAKGEASSVLVEWETAQELNHMGFYLYRAKSPWGPFTRITDKLISGLTSSVVGRKYSFEDKDVTPGEIYYYQLEDLDTYGKKTLHGPICVDWDGDGLPDDWEITHGLNPGFDDADLDWDGDGLTNLQEYLRGTDPFNPDTDGDGILDGDEGVERDPNDQKISATLGPGVYLVASDEKGVTLELRTDTFDFDIVQAEGQEFERLRIKDYIHGFTDEVGKPELPLKGILVDIPEEFSASLTVLETESEVNTGYRIYPVPETVVDDQGELSHVGETFVIDEAAYTVDAFYPDVPALLGKEYLFRGQQKQQIFFYPLTFNPATGELRHLRRIRVRVDYVDAGAVRSSSPEPTVWKPPVVEELSVDAFSVMEMAAWEPPSQESTPVYKILVSEEGIYRLTRSWLEARGVNVAAIDLSRVRIYNLGQEIAISVYDENSDSQFDPEDYIDFYGKAVEETYAKYTTQNVYWLTLEGGVGAPKRMTAIDGTPASVGVPTTYSFSVHHEEDRRYWAKAPGSDSLDRYFFDPYLYGEDIADAAAGVPIDFTFFLPGVSGTAKGTLTIMMAGTWAPDHQVAVSLNGTSLGTYSWSDIAFYEATIEDVDLVDGNNTVTLKCLTGVDAIAVDWFEVTYPRSFEADNNVLRFTYETGYRFQVSGFTADTLLAFDITSPEDVERVINFEAIDAGGPGPYTLDFEPESAPGERTYLVLTSGQVKVPDAIIEDVYGNLANPALGADYILITHRDIGWDVSGNAYPWLNDLAALRQAQGLRVKVVDVEDVFDEFSYGIESPEAIRDFLTYAYTSWTPPAPQYVLLVGDSTRNPKNNPDPSLGLDSVTTYIPAYLTFTEHNGESATDEWFVRVSGDDGISDLYIGRLPAKSAAEATNMVNKILTYEQSVNTKSWEKNVLLLADDQKDGPEYEYEATFELMNNDVAALLPEAMNDPFKGYLNDYFDADDLSAQIMAHINNGTLMVNYSGHSSVQILANHKVNYENIFNNADVATLTNTGMYPLFVGMGCLSGNFLFPEGWNFPSLAEALLRAEDKGAIAAVMSTGQTTTEGQHILDSALFDAIFNQDIRMLGPAVSAAKQTLMANGDSTYEEVYETFLLFGDPAMTLKVPLPRRPENLSAQGHTGGVLLSWNASTDCNGEDLDGYNLYRSTTPGGPYTKVNTSLITGTQYDDTLVSSTMAQYSSSAAASGTTYYYVVTSVDAKSDESVYSQEASGGTQSANPPASESSGGGGGGGGCFINTVTGN